MLQVRPDRLLHLELRVHGALVVTIISAFLNYIVSFGALGDKWTSLLHLPVDQFNFLLDLLEELLEASLLEN